MSHPSLQLLLPALLLPVLLCSTPGHAAPRASRPHILMVIADDFGWANWGYHRSAGSADAADKQGAIEAHTPRIDALARSGIVLDRHYAYRICSPSRSSFQSGRLAVHVNTVNTGVVVQNSSDPVSGYAGIPTKMTTIAAKLKGAGYATHMTGKWDAGMATPEHTPHGRGYDSWYGYYQHANEYWQKGMSLQSTGELDGCLNRFSDLSETNATYRGGAARRDLDASCSTSTEPDPPCYEEALFRDRSLGIIDAHDPSKQPLFLVHAFHLVHSPLQVPLSYIAEARASLQPEQGEGKHDGEHDGEMKRKVGPAAAAMYFDDAGRQNYSAMVRYMDRVVGNLTDRLQAKGMWNDTLLVFTSDNVSWGRQFYQLEGGGAAQSKFSI